MNRPIKFRAKGSGLWRYGQYVHTSKNPPHPYNRDYTDYIVSFDEFGYHHIPITDIDTLGQFTGLLDKNGIEIYEGDIVRLFDFKNCQVVFERGAFCYATNYWVGPFSSNTNLHIGENGACPEVEIVGNIHDNNIDELIEKIE